MCQVKSQQGCDDHLIRGHQNNLDVIISVGYRVDSTKATQFRQ